MWIDRGGGFDESPPDSLLAERLQGVFDMCERLFRDPALPLLELVGDDLPSPTSTGDGRARNGVTVSLGLGYGNPLNPTTPRAEVHVSVPGREPVETMMLDLPPLGPTPDVDTDTDSLGIVIDGEPMSPVYPRRHNTDWVIRVPYRGNIVTVAGHRWEPSGGTLELRPVTDVSPYLANFVDAIKAINDQR